MLSRFFGHRRHDLASLSEQQILALAISSEEDDARIYLAYADGLRENFPQSAKVFEEMAEEENGHRQSLIDLHQQRFGNQIPLIRREHVTGYLERKPDWLVRPLGIDRVRGYGRENGRAGLPLLYGSAETCARCLDAQAARRPGRRRKGA